MENENIIYLAGEDGEELGFEFLDTIPYEGKQYAVLFPIDEQDNELVVLEVEDGENENEGGRVALNAISRAQKRAKDPPRGTPVQIFHISSQSQTHVRAPIPQ